MCVKRIALGRPPKTLCLHLRRAYWTNTGRHIKLSGRVRFPLTLSINPYSAASLPPLSTLSQQYVPDAVQSFWLSLAGGASQLAANSATTPKPFAGTSTGTAAAGAHHAADSKRQGEVNTADGASTQPTAERQSTGSCSTIANSVHANDSEAGACEGDKGGTSRADARCPEGTSRGPVQAALSLQHDESSISAGSDAAAPGDAPADSEAGTGAQDAVVRFSAETPHSSTHMGASTVEGECALSNSCSKLHRGDAPSSKDKEPVSPHQSNSPLSSLSPGAHCKADREADQGIGHSPRAGRVSSAGPVKRLLASHALSLASSLTSQSSLLSDEALDPDTVDEAQLSVKQANTEAGERGAGPRQMSSATQVHQGKSNKGPLQKVLTSHALSLASSLTSQASMGSDPMLEGTACLPVSDDGADCPPVNSKAPAPNASAVPDAEQANGGSDSAATASSRSDQAARLSLQFNAGSQEGCSRVSPCTTEPLISDAAEQMKDAGEVQDLARTQYHLVAAVVHHGGGSSSGHYTVYRRVRCEGQERGGASSMLPQDCWFSISDEYVYQVDVTEVLQCEATLLMYEQQLWLLRDCRPKASA